jgi:methylated-DNA-[protein]-cysteine S-methyltransferase
MSESRQQRAPPSGMLHRMMNDTTVNVTLLAERLKTPLGTLVILTDDADRVRAVDWTDYEPRMQRLLRRHYGWDGGTLPERATRSPAHRALAAYFDGDRHAIDSIVTATGGTPFQRGVWRALRRIPVGRTMSYAALAMAMGQPRAVRAVGLANGANPIGIIVPCHRVIGANGSLIGYGGGLERKRWLLAFEGALTPALQASPAADDSWA